MELPVEISLAADGYAMSFNHLSHDAKLMLREAVLYGAGLMMPTGRLLEPCEELTDDHFIPIGIYRNKKKMREVPAIYYIWMYDHGVSHPGVKKYILDRLNTLKIEAAKARRK